MTVSKSIHNNNPEITNKFLQASGIPTYRIITLSPCRYVMTRGDFASLISGSRTTREIREKRAEYKKKLRIDDITIPTSCTCIIRVPQLFKSTYSSVEYAHVQCNIIIIIIIMTRQGMLFCELQYRNICVPMMISSLGRTSTIFVDVSQLLLDRSASCTTFRFPFVCRPLTNASERTIITKLLSGAVFVDDSVGPMRRPWEHAMALVGSKIISSSCDV
ncbi:hypothetical protein QTP88_006949 [Uroleucon formosanum]